MKIALSVKDAEKAKGQESPYFKAMIAAGARPEELDLIAPEDKSQLRPEAYDGVMFGGGKDVDPQRYGEHNKYPELVETDSPRDEFELKLLAEMLRHRLPILGICRGIQLINVGFGGTLHQDIRSELGVETGHRQQGRRNDLTHLVTITDSDSCLASLVDASCRVNSLHHQAVKRLGHGLKVTAHAKDGVIEALESAEAYPFMVAVQWHPEELVVECREQRRIFEAFLEMCREHASRRHR
jgi:putative glutamine amidotransferase